MRITTQELHATGVPARIPPHNLDAERALLGAVLLEGRDALPRVAAVLKPDDFYLDAHRTIFAAMLRMLEADAPVDLITLSEELRRTESLQLVGGLAALGLLIEQASIATNLMSYVGIVRDKALERDLIIEATDAITEAFESRDSRGAIERARAALDRLAERADLDMAGEKRRAQPQPISAVLSELAEGLNTRETDFLACPLPGVNERLGGGLLRGELVALGGRPGVSKSAMVLQWATYAARAGAKTLIVSAEMAAQALGRRMIAQESRVSATSLRRRDLEPYDWPRVVRAIDQLHDLPLAIDDATDTLAGIRRLVRGQGYRFVVVDYLQLIRSPSDGRENRRLEVSAVIQALKRLARRERCTVMALSSLTRLTVDRGKTQRPDADKLKESGDIEHAADVVLILHWPDVEQSERELIFAKVREGESGGKAMTLDFDPTTVRFVVPDAAPGREEAPF